MTLLWRRIDLVENAPAHLSIDDICIFARDYTAGAGYAHSEGNQLVLNFKKSPDRRDRAEWRHRERAVMQFASELAAILPRSDVVAAIPTSKVRTDPQYDRRFDDMLRLLANMRSDIRVVAPIERRQSTSPLHSGKSSRRVEQVYTTLYWTGFQGDVPPRLILIDDVITCGTHYKACKRLVAENAPRTEVVGVFWARTVWPEREAADFGFGPISP